jgi:hypothetical protein
MAQMTAKIDTITDMDRGKALAIVLADSERELGIPHDRGASFLDRIDAVLKRALGGNLEPRKYAALYIVRKANLHHESPSSGIYV